MGDGMLSLSWNNHRATFCHILATLREKERYTDVTLACEGKFYPVHKLVLSTCSEYFESMFEQTPCKHPIVVLKDVKPEELEALLSYMYAGVVNVAQNDLARLIKVAELLKIKGLAVPDEPPPQEVEAKKTHTPPWSCRDDRTSPHPKRRRKESGTPQGETQASNSPTSPQASPHHVESDHNQDNSRTPSESHVSEHRIDVSERIEQRQDMSSDQNVDCQTKQGSPLQVMIDETLVKEEIVDSLDDSRDNMLDSALDYGSLSADSRVENSTGDNSAPDHHSQMLPNKYDQSLVSSQPHLPDAVVEALAGPSGMQGWLGGNELSGGFSAVDSYSGEGRHQDLRQSLPGQQPQGHQLVVLDSDGLVNGGRGATGFRKGFASTSKKQHMCPHCPYASNVATNLRNHMRTHTGEKPFTCAYCPYSAITKDNLKRHIRNHTGEKPYECQVCPYRSTEKGKVMSHILSQHQSRNLDYLGENN
ncbi:longitudinals lacking protein, isoforms H/M/V isoform X7 [Procambarus clarkii]|uniref:longitudinals lacking protein, isoforms H/M/V isoform X7 n=1 Tax=Procambarus clarkii TaxID=6728 RepID=UPI001E66FFD2|nr:longitudinals lacking protein, isoforms H/M/V-like isoform X7 [Procambarus clarkii]